MIMMMYIATFSNDQNKRTHLFALNIKSDRFDKVKLAVDVKSDINMLLLCK